MGRFGIDNRLEVDGGGARSTTDKRDRSLGDLVLVMRNGAGYHRTRIEHSTSATSIGCGNRAGAQKGTSEQTKGVGAGAATDGKRQ